MTDTITVRHDCAEEAGSSLLPADPYRSLRVNFGMLLGVDDFETLGAYHRGKTWLHTAWLHREGVVWGLDVQIDTKSGEIRVLPGLAIDRLGRELHLDATVCVNVGRWLADHAKDPDLKLETLPDGSVRFDAHVVIRFRPCLDRPVPALVEPCEGAGSTTSFSRVFETVELLLLPGKAPERGEQPYHRLRLLFFLEEPWTGDRAGKDTDVVDERTRILGLPADEQPAAYLAAFRRFAPFDEIDLAPAAEPDGGEVTLFPALDPAPVVLADVTGITLDADKTKLLDATVDVTVRPVLVATATIQELLCGPLFSGLAAAAPPPAPVAPEPPYNPPPPASDAADAGGPRIDRSSVGLTPKRITFAVQGELHPASLRPIAFRVHAFDDSQGWSLVSVKSITQSKGQVTVALKEEAKGSRIRLVVKGTGGTPVLGRNLIPLAGALDDPPATADDGRDFVVLMSLKERS